MLVKLITRGNDTNFSYEGQLHLENMGKVNYNEMNLKFFHVIRKQSLSISSLGLDFKHLYDFDSYFTMTYV